MQAQATPLSRNELGIRNGFGIKNKENILETTNRKKLNFKTPSVLITTGKTSALKSHGKKSLNPVERLKLGEVKNGTPQRLTAARINPTKQIKPTTTKKKNISVWKDSSDPDAKSAERSPLSKTKSEQNHVGHQVHEKKAKNINVDNDIVEYGPPNTFDKLCWMPEDADLLDIASWDVKLQPALKPYVPCSIVEAVKNINSDKPISLEFEPMDPDDFSFPTLKEFEIDFKFDSLEFEKLAFRNSRKLKKRSIK